jgi:hypothetical protein
VNAAESSINRQLTDAAGRIGITPLDLPESFHDAAGSGRQAKGYLLGSYRIATAPEPNSSRLTSLKSTSFDSPANNVGPWPASLG